MLASVWKQLWINSLLMLSTRKRINFPPYAPTACVMKQQPAHSYELLKVIYLFFLNWRTFKGCWVPNNTSMHVPPTPSSAEGAVHLHSIKTITVITHLPTKSQWGMKAQGSIFPFLNIMCWLSTQSQNSRRCLKRLRFFLLKVNLVSSSDWWFKEAWYISHRIRDVRRQVKLLWNHGSWCDKEAAGTQICTAGADCFNIPERALGIDRRLSCTRGSSAALTNRRGT